MTDLKYKNKILEYSELLNLLQRPIQILDSIKWPIEVEQFFLKTKFKELPKIDSDYYKSRPLKYNPSQKKEEFKNLREKIRLDLGARDPLGKILIRNCEQYERVIEMLQSRGTSQFYEFSKELYGSANEKLNDNRTNLSDLSFVLEDIIKGLRPETLGPVSEKNISSEDAVAELKKRLRPYFVDEKIKIKLADGIVSDASAGSDYIKIKSEQFFSKRDLHVFEVHEGWVHLGTTLNGQKQNYAKWLSKGPPCSTITQEGLAVIIELFNFALYPKRVKKLNDRLYACKMAEEGANALEIIEYYRNQGMSEIECIGNTSRTFRGGVLEGGAPFTKDITYLKGFIEIYNFLRTTIKQGHAEVIPFLFAGKVTLSDVPTLHHYYEEGVISFPHFLPPQIKDLNGLAVWMAFSNFLNQMKISDIEKTEEEKIKLIA